VSDFLYVCQFSNGHIKVGRSIDPQSRIAQHADRVSCMGVEMVEHFIAECVCPAYEREQALISQCADAASRRFKSEWFDGLDYPTVCEWATHAATCQIEAASRRSTILSLDERRDLAARLGMTPSVLLQALNGERPAAPAVAVRIEHASNGAVCRWHLRPDDWHLIWPELVRIKGAPPVPSTDAQPS
jgi:DNA-binding transcriptional regulator YdaS (Cro superfamily)